MILIATKLGTNAEHYVPSFVAGAATLHAMGRIKDAWRALTRASFALDDTDGAPYQPVVLSKSLLFGRVGQELVSREEALSIPGVLRARNLICSISTLPLQAATPQHRTVLHPLLEQIDPNVPNVVTMAQLIEDLLFESVAWLRVTEWDWIEPGYMVPAHAIRYEPSQVTFNAPEKYMHGYLPSDLPTEGVVWMDGEPVPFGRVIRFDSPNPPVLETVSRTLARAVALDEAARMYAENPRPQDYFRPSDPNVDPGSDEEIQAALDNWAEMRRQRATGYVPAALEYNEVQQPTPADLQLVQLQNQAAKDVAISLGLDPEDVGVSTTSRTYQNMVDRRKDRINDVFSPFMAAITQRLDMPDVTPPELKTRFWLDDYLRADPKTRSEVNATYLDKGVLTREWVAASEGLPPEAVPREAPAVRPAAPINASRAIVGDPRELEEA